jgi:hypothetical protein
MAGGRRRNNTTDDHNNNSSNSKGRRKRGSVKAALFVEGGFLSDWPRNPSSASTSRGPSSSLFLSRICLSFTLCDILAENRCLVAGKTEENKKFCEKETENFV